MTVVFDVEKLNKTDRKIYDAMTDTERQAFERTWIQIETQKIRLMQQKNASKERANRERRALAEKERKERTHRLIERGAILEAYISESLDFSNEEIKQILKKTLTTEYSRKYIETVRASHFSGNVAGSE